MALTDFLGRLLPDPSWGGQDWLCTVSQEGLGQNSRAISGSTTKPEICRCGLGGTGGCVMCQVPEWAGWPLSVAVGPGAEYRAIFRSPEV